MARQVLENGVILPAEYSDDWYDDMTSNLTKLDDVIGSDSEKLSSADVGAAALSNNYNDLDNLPTIPTVNNAVLTIQKNGVDVQTFTANASSNVTANITVPTKTSDLTNDSNFVDTSNSAVASGITSTKVTDYDTHIADTDIHVTTTDKNKWNNQTYVFRYSSTVLTASSTNSNTLLDNTDNLKVGDKVIDSSGVLFSITAIDTANSTFTIGTALIDLATDSDVVHKSGDESIAGTKTFTDNNIIKTSSPKVLLINTSQTGNTAPSSNTASFFRFDGGTVSNFGGVQCDFITTGENRLTNYVKDITTAKLNSIQQRANSTTAMTVFNADLIIPSTDGVTALGGSSKRWSNVYGLNYYYGSNNVEFSTKFVTTDTAQTISGTKTFNDSPLIYNSDSSASIPQISLKNQKVVKSSTTETGAQLIYFTDKNNNALGQIEVRVVSNGTTGLNLTSFGLDSNNQNISSGVQILRSPTTANFAPNADNAVTCGRALAKWSGVYSNEYYYGANNTPFTDKFVTTDTAQTIGGEKTFNNVVPINGVYIGNEPSTSFRTVLLLRSRYDTAGKSGWLVSKFRSNSAQGALSSSDTVFLNFDVLENEVRTNGILRFNLSSWSGNVPGRFSLVPNANIESLLGTTGNKWSAINGLEPSSLSLPSDRSARIDISSYITNLGNGDNNTYTVPANGYIWLRFTSINSALCYSQTSGGLTNYAQTFVRYQGDGQLYAFFPVRKDDTFVVQIYTSSTAVVENAYFIPCKGNV